MNVVTMCVCIPMMYVGDMCDCMMCKCCVGAYVICFASCICMLNTDCVRS